MLRRTCFAFLRHVNDILRVFCVIVSLLSVSPETLQNRQFWTVRCYRCANDSEVVFGAGVSLDRRQLRLFCFAMHDPRGAGTLYAGDGIVIQQSDSSQGCNALLRYPRSSFASRNMTLCVCCSCVLFCCCCCFPLIRLLVCGPEPANLTTAPSKTCCNQMDRQNFLPIIK